MKSAALMILLATTVALATCLMTGVYVMARSVAVSEVSGGGLIKIGGTKYRCSEENRGEL